MTACFRHRGGRWMWQHKTEQDISFIGVTELWATDVYISLIIRSRLRCKNAKSCPDLHLVSVSTTYYKTGYISRVSQWTKCRRLRSHIISYPDTKHTRQTWWVLLHDVNIRTYWEAQLAPTVMQQLHCLVLMGLQLMATDTEQNSYHPPLISDSVYCCVKKCYNKKKD